MAPYIKNSSGAYPLDHEFIRLQTVVGADLLLLNPPIEGGISLTECTPCQPSFFGS